MVDDKGAEASNQEGRLQWAVGGDWWHTRLERHFGGRYDEGENLACGIVWECVLWKWLVG